MRSLEAARWWLRLALAGALGCVGCASDPPPVAATAAVCPPPPPPIYSKDCVLKTDVLDVAQSILDENAAHETQLAKLQKSFAMLQQDVAKALEKSLKNVASEQVSVAIVGNRVRVRLSNELLFPSGSAELSPSGLHALSQVAGVLRTTPSRRIEVAGHTDDRPVQRGWRDNWQLSAERARQVVVFLSSHGLAANRMFMAGYADTDPADNADTESARAKNRRVELFIEPVQGDAKSGTGAQTTLQPAPPAR
jgi:chemotaxis protein MotB